MPLKLYNTLTKKKEIFKSIKKGKVGIYTCGPTVYWYQHIGNLRSYIFADVLKRVLEYNGLKVKHVINVTDVGHLTSDADYGDDKIENAAKREGKTANEIAEFYFNEFHKDFKKLNLLEPSVWPRATNHIKEQIALIKALEKKGYTYQTADGIYFDTSKFKRYGWPKRKKAKIEQGKRVSMREKKHKTDFALWKFSDGQNRLQEWMSKWGKGFPGWHIECSAMSSKYLGKQFDIHTGGIDHLPIHHPNEIAQSECAFGVHPWVRFWMHGAFLTIAGGKMSKSTGEIKTISELETEDHVPPLAYKYFTYSAHYRKPLSWNFEAIRSAVNSYKRLREIIDKLKQLGDKSPANKRYLEKFEKKINDDLDMPGAISVLWQMLRDTKAGGKVATIKEMDKVFGLKLLGELPKNIQKKKEQRDKAREKGDYKKADKIRKEIEEMGWRVKDTPDGTVISGAYVYKS